MSDPIVELRGVDVRYSETRPPAIAEIDLQVARGEAIGIVGESGSGKTTLGRVIVGDVRPTGGIALVQGRPWSSVRRRDDARRGIQMVFQDPYASLNPRLSARETVAEVCRVWHRGDRREARRRAVSLLAEVGLSEPAISRRPGQLSGGQCQRVGIARALACDPAVLVADEPTSSLDVSVQAQILNLIMDLRESRELALVLISHDLSVVRYATERAVVMYRGRIVEHGPTAQLLEAPQDDYTRSLVESIPGRRAQASAGG